MNGQLTANPKQGGQSKEPSGKRLVPMQGVNKGRMLTLEKLAETEGFELKQ